MKLAVGLATVVALLGACGRMEDAREDARPIVQGRASSVLRVALVDDAVTVKARNAKDPRRAHNESPGHAEDRGTRGAGDSVVSGNHALMDDDVGVRLDAVSMLSSVGSRDAAVALAAAAVSDGAPAVREDAVYALGEIGDETSIPVLEQALLDRDEDVREAAVEALAEIGGETAIRLLRQAAAGQRGSVREAAADILAELGSQPSTGRTRAKDSNAEAVSMR